MNAPRLASMTALVASLVIVVLAITQVNGSQPDTADLSTTAQFCIESVAADGTVCGTTLTAGAIHR